MTSHYTCNIQISIKVYIQWTAEVRVQVSKPRSKSHCSEELLAEKNFKNMSCVFDGKGWLRIPDWLKEVR